MDTQEMQQRLASIRLKVSPGLHPNTHAAPLQPRTAGYTQGNSATAPKLELLAPQPPPPNKDAYEKKVVKR